MTHRFFLTVGLVAGLSISLGCSKSKTEGDIDQDSFAVAKSGDDAAVPTIMAAVRALTQPDPSVDYVASEMKGVIKASTESQSLIHYDGYRATLTTPRQRVTRVIFDLVTARPTMAQLTEELGTPEEVRRGMLYSHDSAVTGASIRILAEPVEKPATEASLVRRVVIEGARTN